MSGTVLAARSVAGNDAENSHQAIGRASAQIVSTLRLAIRHEEDLVVSAGAFALENPTASNAAFGGWLREVHAFTRYPELSVVGRISLIPRSRLPAFEERSRADLDQPAGGRRDPGHPPAGNPAVLLLSHVGPGSRRSASDPRRCLLRLQSPAHRKPLLRPGV
jgi:hypothetical protein